MIVFEICHTDEKFSCMSINVCEIDTQVMIVWLILIKSLFIIFWFSSSSRSSSLIFIKFIIQISDAAFWNFAYRRKIFRVCQSAHTKATQQLDRRYYREKCFDRIRSDQIRSNQIRSNQIRSDQACLHRLVRSWERQSRCVLYKKISIRSLWLSLMSVFVRCKEWSSIERILMRWSRSFWS